MYLSFSRCQRVTGQWLTQSIHYFNHVVICSFADSFIQRLWNSYKPALAWPWKTHKWTYSKIPRCWNTNIDKGSLTPKSRDLAVKQDVAHSISLQNYFFIQWKKIFLAADTAVDIKEIKFTVLSFSDMADVSLCVACQYHQNLTMSLWATKTSNEEIVKVMCCVWCHVSLVWFITFALFLSCFRSKTKKK